MQIAVNTICLGDETASKNQLFLQQVVNVLMTKYPEHHFFLIVRNTDKQCFNSSANSTPVLVRSAITSLAALKIWNNVQLPRILKKLKADVVLQPYGLFSAVTRIPQVIVIENLLWINQPRFLTTMQAWRAKYHTKQAIKKANQVIVLSASAKQDLIAQFPKVAHKISFVSAAANPIFQPIDSIQRQQTKDSYADGREYFLFAGGNQPVKNIEGMLKAFSLFKKWHKSNMKLLVAGAFSFSPKNDVLAKLNSYKYKEDVVLLKDITIQQLATVTAAAYAFICPAFYEADAVPLLSAIQCGVPVIAAANANLKEAGGEACLYAPANDIEALANQMKLLYKDEQQRSALIAKGLQEVAVFNWEKTADTAWDCLEKAVG
ncbi:glycosyltransferase family 4 protein [Parasediminibacterium sp. JCM 36343]|uniref:glycosyltransferase family 4 protein n=1 Tax=Parasediminibacterium sp. JCM 36343 TaxID=3374279 RepID=UPI00397D02AC